MQEKIMQEFPLRREQARILNALRFQFFDIIGDKPLKKIHTIFPLNMDKTTIFKRDVKCF